MYVKLYAALYLVLYWTNQKEITFWTLIYYCNC